MDYLTVLQMLNSCHGPSGDEGQVASTIKRLAVNEKLDLDTAKVLIAEYKKTRNKEEL